MISQFDRDSFKLYLQQCTDAQVEGVIEKERKAGRKTYLRLAEEEKQRRAKEWR